MHLLLYLKKFLYLILVSFFRHLDFCTFVKSNSCKICDTIKVITAYWKLHLLFLLNPRYSRISIKRTPLVQKKCPLYRDVRFTEIFSKTVWQQSKAIRSSSYCPSYEGVRFIVCPLYRDSTVVWKCDSVKY